MTNKPVPPAAVRLTSTTTARAHGLFPAFTPVASRCIIPGFLGALRAFHRENDKKKSADAKVLIAQLETIIAKCKEWLLIGKPDKGPDAERKKEFDGLLKEARTELRVHDPSNAAAVEPPAAAAPPIPALPALTPSLLFARLDWMDIKRQQANATQARTMKHYRQLGFADEIRSLVCPRNFRRISGTSPDLRKASFSWAVSSTFKVWRTPRLPMTAQFFTKPSFSMTLIVA